MKDKEMTLPQMSKFFPTIGPLQVNNTLAIDPDFAFYASGGFEAEFLIDEAALNTISSHRTTVSLSVGAHWGKGSSSTLVGCYRKPFPDTSRGRNLE